MENKVIITFEKKGCIIEFRIAKPQLSMVSADILAIALSLAASGEKRDRIREKFNSQLTETLGALESGESDD